MKKLLGFLLLCLVFVGLLLVLKSRLTEEAQQTASDASGAGVLEQIGGLLTNHGSASAEETQKDGKSYADMTVRELVEAIADYRDLTRLFASSDLAEGMEDLKEECGAYAELITRDNWREALAQYGSELIEQYKLKPREDGKSSAVSEALQGIIDFVKGK